MRSSETRWHVEPDIVTMGSIAGMAPLAHMAVYATTKKANVLVNLTFAE